MTKSYEKCMADVNYILVVGDLLLIMNILRVQRFESNTYLTLKKRKFAKEIVS